jgi:hypothetical protein
MTTRPSFLFDLDGTLAKPHPDLFIAAAERLNVPITSARAGAYRVYEEPADLLDHLDEVESVRLAAIAPDVPTSA